MSKPVWVATVNHPQCSAGPTISLDCDGKFLYVSTGRSKLAMVLDTETDKVIASVEAGERPWGIGVSPDGKTLYTANGPSDDVSAIDIASRNVVKKIPVGHGPWGLVVVEAP